MRKRKAKSEKRKEGFTLIELLIYLALVSAVVTSLILWVLNLSGVRDKNYVATEVESNRQFIAATIMHEIKQADAIIAPAAGATGATLELDRPDPLPNLIFNLTAGTLYLEVVGSAPIPISSRPVEIINLEFQNLSGVGTSRDYVTTRLDLRYRDSPSNEFQYERGLTFTTSNRF